MCLWVCVFVCVNDGKSDQSLCVLCDSTCRNRLIISLVHSTLLWDISALCFRLFSHCGRKSLGPDITTALLRTSIRHSSIFTYLAYSTLIPKLLKGKKAILFFIFVTYLCCSSTETIKKDQKYNNSNYLIRKSCRNCRWSVGWKWWLKKEMIKWDTGEGWLQLSTSHVLNTWVSPAKMSQPGCFLSSSDPLAHFFKSYLPSQMWKDHLAKFKYLKHITEAHLSLLLSNILYFCRTLPFPNPWVTSVQLWMLPFCKTSRRRSIRMLCECTRHRLLGYAATQVLVINYRPSFWEACFAVKNGVNSWELTINVAPK